MPYRHFDEYVEAVAHLRRQLGPLDGWKVLEAGCGSGSQLDLERSSVTGIDISAHQLSRNAKLSEAVCADLHTYENQAWQGTFDLAVCWDVLEHLQDPALVVAKLMSWVKDDGVLVIAYPSPHTLKGLVTKHSPHLVHRVFYRMFYGTPLDATRHDRGPFPTVFAPSLRLDRLLGQLESLRGTVEHLLSAESPQNKFLKRHLPSGFVDRVNAFLLRDMTPALHPAATDLLFVVRKQRAA